MCTFAEGDLSLFDERLRACVEGDSTLPTLPVRECPGLVWELSVGECPGLAW